MAARETGEATHGGGTHAVVVMLLFITPLRSRAIGAGHCIHIGVGAEVDDILSDILRVCHVPAE